MNTEASREESLESGIKIIVTEDEPEDEIASENVNSSSANEVRLEVSEEQNGDTEEGNGLETEKYGGLKVPDFDTRRESTLAGMDKRHLWLSALVNLESDFMSKIQFVAVSNHCQTFLDELNSDDSMTRFRIEYSRLFDKFRQVFIGSQRFQNKINEIKSYQNIANAENRKLKIQLENERSKIEDQEKILDKVQDELLKMEKEKRMIQIMFNELRDQKVDNSAEEEQETDRKSTISEDDDEVNAKISDLEVRLEMLAGELEFSRQREAVCRSKMEATDAEKSNLQKELNSAKYEIQGMTTRAEKAEASATEATLEAESRSITLKNMAEGQRTMRRDLERAIEESKRILKDFRRIQKKLDSTTHVLEKLRRDINIREDRIKMLEAQKKSIAVDLDNKQAEVHALKGDIASLTKKRNLLSRRVATLTERIADSDYKLEVARKETAAQQKDLDLMKKDLEESGAKAREVAKQKDVLAEEVLKHEQATVKLVGDIKISEDKCSRAEKELSKSNRLADDLKDNIKLLEKSNARLTKETIELNKSISDLRGEIKSLELRISDMKKKEAKLGQQLDEEQAKYKLLADDERHCKKLLAESRHESEQLRDQMIVLKKNVEQLQSYNQDLDEKCKRMSLSSKNMKEQLGNAREMHKREVRNSEDLSSRLKRKDDQEQLLLKNLAEKERVIQVLERKMKNLEEEKNIQNAKIIDKDQEIGDLKENMRVLQQEINSLDKSVNDRVSDIKLLKMQITQMSKNKAHLNEQVEFTDATRQELINTQSRLVEEKVKSEALEREVQRPVNLHRWRILEGIDPERSQLVSKNQELQKQLVRKMTALDGRDLELLEKDRLLQELREQLRRRSGENLQEQLWICNKELNARTERVKCLVTENSMFQNLCNRYEHEIEGLKRRLKKYMLSEMGRKKTTLKR